METRPTSLRLLYTAELPRLYAFAYDMCGDREDARRFLAELIEQTNQHAASILDAPAPADALLGLFARNLEKELGRRAEQTFMILDNVLRSEITKPVDLETHGLVGDPTRVIHTLLWELKRTCLTRVMGCLPPSVRVSFILTDILGYGPAEAADLLDIKESAYRVRLTRARKRIEDYLTPRCYHVDRQNPCACDGRLGIALDARFVAPPPHELDTPSEGWASEPPRRDMASLYRGLPRTLLTAEQVGDLLDRANA
ncbi:MAG: sigma factor-like helix-turn-helix DNA-binding protein [Nannocystaceae bacterium]